MLAARLIRLIEDHADSLTREALEDILTNPRTASFRTVPRNELAPRVHALYQNLGNWIGDPGEDKVRQEYEAWGRTRFRQGISLSEIVYTLILAKHHLRQYIRDHGLVEYSGDRVVRGELLPVQMHGIQELNTMVGEFFDRALYYLARGYESEAAAARGAAAQPRTPR